MKKYLICLFSCLVVLDAEAVTSRAGRAVPTPVMLPVGMGSSARQRQGDFKTGPIPLQNEAAPVVPVLPDTPVEPEEPEVNPVLEEIARQRSICLSNNIGISNTFVWADKNSNVSNYTYMVENVDNPENNACFVKVDMKSSDARIDMSDVKSKYFLMGSGITCGNWVDEKILEERILEATKKGRTWGTIASAVGGAGVGVGAMELFGNKLIGGKVEGQKALDGQELLRSQLLALKKSNKAEYDRIYSALEILEAECKSDVWKNATKPADCDATKNLFLGLKDTLK